MNLADKIEVLHGRYLALYPLNGPTIIRQIAQLRIQLIGLVGERSQQRLIGLWNREAEKKGYSK